MRFNGTCDTCGTREGPFEGERSAVAGNLGARGWRYEESAGGKLTCADCAEPPSVFPGGRLVSTARQCSACGAVTGVCVACRAPIAAKDVISCRGQHGHAHARCSTQRMKKLTLPNE